MRKGRIVSFIVVLTMMITTVFSVPAPVQGEDTLQDGLIIHQVYGGGGKSETPVSHSFIEIYNPTGEDVSLNGYKLTYTSNRTAGDAGSTEGEEVELELSDVTLPSGTSYLVRCTVEVTAVQLLTIENFDQEWDRVIDNKQYVVKLKNADGVMVDGVTVVGQPGDEVASEGTPLTGISKQKAIRRVNGADTNDNSADFEVIEYRNATEEFLAKNQPRSMNDGAWEPAESTEPGGEGEGTEPEEPGQEEQPESFLNTVSDTGLLKYLGSYSTGTTSGDGGVAEIVKFNPDNQKMYLVSGVFQSVDIVSLENLVSDQENSFTMEERIDIGALASAHGFTAGDITSIDVNPVKDLIAISVQAEGYADNGSIVLLDYDGNYIAHTEAGVQPDMVVFTQDGNYVLTANEGEPRMGYGEGTVDPKGSVTIAKLGGEGFEETTTVDFTSFDADRQSLVDNGVLLKPGTAPSVDLEPEYIAIAEDGRTAYVSLQEANAIATLDIETGTFTSIKGLGFKDHSLPGNELDLNNNGEINIQNEDVMGIFLPDGIATVNIGGTQYLLTANEGDGREWGGYEDVGSKVINGSAKKVEYKLSSEYDGLDEGTTYLLGARSFSIWDAATMTQVFDSGADFESITARIFPENFNANHKKATMEGRSHKKGPEPEDVQTLSVNDKTYAVIGLERMGGVMVYDISIPTASVYADYINIRDFSNDDLANGSDLGPEGISTVEARYSPTGKPLILVANEVSGTVTVLEMDVEIEEDPLKTKRKN